MTELSIADLQKQWGDQKAPKSKVPDFDVEDLYDGHDYALPE